MTARIASTGQSPRICGGGRRTNIRTRPKTHPSEPAQQPKPRFLQPLLLILARLTDRQLAAVVQYLKVENEILRNRLPRREWK